MPERNKFSRCFLSVTLLMFLMVVAVSVTPVAEPDGTAHQTTTAVSDTRRGGPLLAGTPHGAIAIDGDDDFSDIALLEGWPGDGSPENPYIIDGLEIDLTRGVGHCININNTRVSFTISNCILFGASMNGWGEGEAGIHLENVTNGELVNNTCCGNDHGIRIWHSTSNNVVNNTCNNNECNGIYLEASESNTVVSNNCTSNGVGIRFEHSHSNTFANNTCSSNNLGISLYLSEFNTVAHNTCTSNCIGINMHVAKHNLIEDNTCNNNDQGIHLYYSDYNTVAHNTCNFNSIDHGIVLYDSDSNTVAHNTCNKNRIGIYLDSSSDSNILANNTCIGNTDNAILEEADPEEPVIIDPKVLLFIGVAGIIMLGAGWRIVKLSRADISETWIGGEAIVKHGSRRSCFHAWSRADSALS